MLTPDQLMAAQKANIETLYGLTRKAFEGVEKLVELNLEVAKTALADSSDKTQAALNAKDVQDILALQASLIQPLAEKTADYSRQLYEIAAQTGVQFTQAAETQASDAQQKLMSVVDNLAKNAPAGSEAAVAAMKNAFTTANQALESVQQAVKQAGEIAQANFNSATAPKGSAKKR